MAYFIHLRIKQITSADSIEDLLKHSVGRCHPLVGNRKGSYAMDIGQPYRLIFEKVDDELRIVQILEITDYH